MYSFFLCAGSAVRQQRHEAELRYDHWIRQPPCFCFFSSACLTFDLSPSILRIAKSCRKPDSDWRSPPSVVSALVGRYPYPKYLCLSIALAFLSRNLEYLVNSRVPNQVQLSCCCLKVYNKACVRRHGLSITNVTRTKPSSRKSRYSYQVL